MSQDFWAVTMFGVYLDLEDLQKLFPQVPTEDPLELQDHVVGETGLDVCAHMVDGQIIGAGIGVTFSEGLTVKQIKAALTKAEKKLPKITKGPFKIIGIENSDDG